MLKPATNNPKLDFKSLTSEEWREYTFLVERTSGYGGFSEYKIRIDKPQALNVSMNGHRIQAENGNGIYVPTGWIKLEWQNKETEEASIQF